MTAEPTLLVLGVGGNVSQGILKALRLGRLGCRVVSACTDSDAMGLYTSEKAYLSPAARDEGFADWLIDVCRRETVRGILSGVEPVLWALARHREAIERGSPAVPVVSSVDALEIGGDKLVTARWLDRHGLPAPRSAPSESSSEVAALVSECGYPLIAKPRGGKGAAGVVPVHGEADLERALRRPRYVIQEMLGDPAEEFTAATFSDRQGQVRGCIAIRRELRAGTTFRAEVGEFPAVRRRAIEIAQALRPLGPCNMQFRVRDRQPVCFEINVRFSGTAPMRAFFGFNDVEAAVRHIVLGEEAVDLPLVTRGLAVRYWNEIYLDADEVRTLATRGVLDRPAARARVEDYGMRGCGS